MKKTPKAKVYDIGTGRPAILRAANEDEPRTGGEDHLPSQQRAPNSFGIFLRHVLVMVMMWLRGPLRFLAALVAIPTMIALPIVVLGMDSSPQKTTMVLSLLGVSFGSFCLRWLYDSLVMWISPDPLFLNT